MLTHADLGDLTNDTIFLRISRTEVIESMIKMIALSTSISRGKMPRVSPRDAQFYNFAFRTFVEEISQDFERYQKHGNIIDITDGHRQNVESYAIQRYTQAA